ncbi:EAL domain-containing protein [Paucibacter sp. AS339]|uniref:putative bifunctional diguanylate cyclase/phosphodiesterase n=1 Tax=Paucibacter hankyongi TaxID=3133434 RepID=UPI0030B744E1
MSAQLFPVWLHTLLEIASALVSFLVFAAVWNAAPRDRAPHSVLLGLGFLGVGLLDLGHLLSYRGMPDFITPASPQKAILFWLCARYLAAFVLLMIALWPRQLGRSQTRDRAALALVMGYTVLCYVLVLVWPQHWPVFFVPGQGLTPVKILAEYGLVLLLLPATWLLLNPGHRQRFNSGELASAALITVLSELCFTLYAEVSDGYILIGHVYKVIAYYFIYRAVYVVSVQRPYARLSEEIAEHRRTGERLEYLAHHDPLTGLPNRILLQDRMTQALAQARRDGSKLALVLMDLDQFKSINDSLGHRCGDALLQGVAQRLLADLRETDSVCRIGGDEFLVLFQGLQNKASLMPILTAVQARLSTPIPAGETDICVTASFGVAFYPDDGSDMESLQREADAAMYRAKESGRNTIRFFDPEMHVLGAARMQMQHGLARALERGELSLHYQPQFDLGDGRIVGVEALLRWQRSDGQFVPPAEFIPVAEQSGLIVPISAWVLSQACREAACWHEADAGSPSVAVNLSALQFRQGDVGADVRAALADSGLPPQKLDLELTESILLSKPEAVLATVTQLKAIGVRLSIDDFGTGYSSLSYLSRFPVDKLKIDRSFLSQRGASANSLIIIESILSLARSLGLQSVAEGVESAEMAAELCGLGCQQAQGYYFARPMPATELRALMALAPRSVPT